MTKRKRIQVCDTTLRDGAQAEGVSFSNAAKKRLAKRLDRFGVDYIEGGYAGSNPTDMEFFREVRGEKLSHAVVVAFGSTRRARTKVGDDASVRSLLDAGTDVVTVVGKAWTLHVTDVLRATEKENLAMVSDTVGFLKDRGRKVLFDAEHFFDGYKADPDFALRVLKTAAAAGADLVVLCDTNGGTLPHEVFAMTQQAVDAQDAPVGIHAHNDCGMGVANSVEAVRAGAVHVQGTVNGYGERCGNADLCAILPTLALKMGFDVLSKGSLAKLRELSVFVDDLVNIRPNPKAPYVGRSAFTHKAGQHVDAVKKNPKTFEHIRPAKVGNERHTLVSEISGTSSVLLKAVELGLGRKESAAGAREILAALKTLESKGYAFEAADASFRMLIQKVLQKHKSFFELEGYRVIVEKRGKNGPSLSEATIKVRVDKDVEQTVAEGDGPVNALDMALRKALVRFYPAIEKVFLTDFRVRILDPAEATAAKTRVLIESSDGKDTWGTVGVSDNIIEASWEALVDSVEYQLFREEERRAAAQRRKRASGKKKSAKRDG
ncbi:MAG: citramalate synthase [Lentisphaerae bacterium]|nr:citramalate synthase [Lentisphaerota bacterium]